MGLANAAPSCVFDADHEPFAGDFDSFSRAILYSTGITFIKCRLCAAQSCRMSRALRLPVWLKWLRTSWRIWARSASVGGSRSMCVWLQCRGNRPSGS